MKKLCWYILFFSFQQYNNFFLIWFNKIILHSNIVHKIVPIECKAPIFWPIIWQINACFIHSLVFCCLQKKKPQENSQFRWFGYSLSCGLNLIDFWIANTITCNYITDQWRSWYRIEIVWLRALIIFKQLHRCRCWWKSVSHLRPPLRFLEE